MTLPILAEPVRRKVSQAKDRESRGVGASLLQEESESCTCPCCIEVGGSLVCCE